ncbi:hypothetical protein D9M70_522770 [compost metagenome]
MPDAAQINVVNNDQVGTLALFNQPAVTGHLSEDARDIPGRKGNGLRRRQLLLSDHPLDRFRNSIPMPAGKIGRNRIDTARIDQRIEVGGIVAPAGPDTIQCRDIDDSPLPSQVPSNRDGLVREKTRVIAMTGDETCLRVLLDHGDQTLRRWRRVVEDRGISDPLGFAGDLIESGQREGNRRHHRLRNDLANAIRSGDPGKTATLQLVDQCQIR